MEGGVAVCGDREPIEDAPCNDIFGCFGETPMCRDGQCIPSEDVCADDMGICTINTCQEQYYEKIACGPPEWNDVTIVECGTTTDLDVSKAFATREYDTYNDDFCPGSLSGMEAAIGFHLSADATVTVSIENPEPAMDVSLMLLGDWCNPSTCEQSGVNTLTFEGLAGLNVVVLETEGDLPPATLDLSVSGCP